MKSDVSPVKEFALLLFLGSVSKDVLKDPTRRPLSHALKVQKRERKEECEIHTHNYYKGWND